MLFYIVCPCSGLVLLIIVCIDPMLCNKSFAELQFRFSLLPDVVFDVAFDTLKTNLDFLLFQIELFQPMIR